MHSSVYNGSHSLVCAQVVDVKILKKKEDDLEVAVLPDNVTAHLPTMHLSDYVSHCKLWWHWLKENDVLPSVMCLHDKGSSIVSFGIPSRPLVKPLISLFFSLKLQCLGQQHLLAVDCFCWQRFDSL